jgi:hypothetical protein
MSNSVNRCRVLATALVTAVAAAALSGCATQGSFEDRASSFLVTPGKYTLYSCPQLAVQSDARIARKRELDALIAKAGPGAGGAVASTLAYSTEYAQVTWPNWRKRTLPRIARRRNRPQCPARRSRRRASRRAVSGAPGDGTFCRYRYY